MNEELRGKVEELHDACRAAKSGDIATLVDLLDRAENLRQYGDVHQLPDLSSPTDGIASLIKMLIMGETPDSEATLKAVLKAVDTLQKGVKKEKLPAINKYPKELREALESASPEAAGKDSKGQPRAPEPGDLSGQEAQSPTASPSPAGSGETAFSADKELLGEYLTEQRARLEEIEGVLLVLEKENSESHLADLRRALHTIKGDSGFLGLSEIEHIAHVAEDFLEASSYPFDLEHLFAMKDWLSRAFEDLATPDGITPATQAALKGLLAKLGDQSNFISESTRAPSSTGGDPAAKGAPGKGGKIPVASSFQLVADESLLSDFVSESKEHLDVASAQLLALENEPKNEEAINSVFRAFHTVKGIAGFLTLDEIQLLAHDTENLLDLVRRNEIDLSSSLIDLVFEALDWMTRLIMNVRKGLEGDGTVTTEPELENLLHRIKIAQETGVVQVDESGPRLGDILVDSGAVSTVALENAVNEVKDGGADKKLGQLLVEKEIVTAKDVQQALSSQKQAQIQGQRKPVELKETLRVDYDRLENMIDIIGELVLAETMISQDEYILSIKSETLGKKLHNLRQVSRNLQELGTTIRMVPISGMFQKMARLVRDLSRKSGKPVNFTTSGDETELDRAYVDLMADPLVHMIRNAVDHGIENPGERKKSGKPENGSVKLRAFHEGGNVHVEINDDGKGMDPEVLFNKAVEKGLISGEEKMSDQECYQLIFLPGFSTAGAVTEVSGRGVGMDVVRRNITELRGQVVITSEKGVGSSFKMVLPLTLALIDGMLVRVGEERFIFPVLSVVESTRPTADMLNTVIGKGEIISIRGRQLPLYRLNRLFNIPAANENVTESLVVIVENNGRQIGVMVDDLVGIQQTVIKPLGHGLLESGGLAGGSILADGTVGLIVDVSGLINMAKNKKNMLSESIL